MMPGLIYVKDNRTDAEKFKLADRTDNNLLDFSLLANNFMPITGDIQSGLLAVNDIKNGDYGSAALNGIGLLPFVPSMAGVIKNIPAPSWKGSKKTIAVGINPTKEEIELLRNTERSSPNGSGYGDLRVLIPNKNGEHYFWPASDALHADIGNYYKLNPKEYKHGILEGD